MMTQYTIHNTQYTIRITLLICVLLHLTVLSTEGAFLDRAGVRPLGMGGAFVGRADDSSAGLWNPAGLAQLKQTEIVANYSALHTGLGEDNLWRSHLGYAFRTHASGALGINLIRLEGPLYSETTAILSYSQRFQSLYLGGNIKGLFANFSENEYTEIDPLFQEHGRLSKNVSFDLGLLLKLSDAFALGMVIQNLNEPNLALEEGVEDPLPREFKAGLSTTFNRVHANLDFTWRDAKIRDNQDVNVHFGVETRLSQDISFRTGANFYELTAGASYRFRNTGSAFQLDYAFNYPMPFDLGDDILPAPLTGTSGSHQFSLSVSFSDFRQLLGYEPLPDTADLAVDDFLKDSDTEELEASLAVYQKALEDDATNPEAHFRLGQIYTQLNQYDEAIGHLRQAAKLVPQNPEYHYTLALIYERYGDTSGRKTWYNKAIIEFEKTRMLDADYNEKIRAKMKTLSQK